MAKEAFVVFKKINQMDGNYKDAKEQVKRLSS
jgi:hypothetical protein